MRLTLSPPWVAGSASNAKTASWHSLSFIRWALACCDIVGLGVAMLLSGVEPFSRWRRGEPFAVLCCRPWPLRRIEEARHDPIAARAQAHSAQSRPLEGISLGLGPAWL